MSVRIEASVGGVPDGKGDALEANYLVGQALESPPD